MAIYHYRGQLTARELLPAIGAGAAVGLAVAYIAQIALRKRTMASGRPEEVVAIAAVAPVVRGVAR